MKQKILFLGLFLSVFLYSAELPVIHSENTETQIKAAETGKLLIVNSPGTKNNTGVPRASLAGRLAVNGKEFHWTPSPLTTRVTGGADLLAAHLSGDETVLLLTERVGGAGKVNSTRLILFCWRNRKIIRVTTLKERRITDTAFIPGTNLILALQQAQPELSQPEALLIIDLRSGRIQAQSAVNGKILSIACSGNKVWYTVANQPFIYEKTQDTLSQAPAKIRTQVIAPRLMLSPDGNILAVFGQKYLELFNVSDEQKTTLRSSIALDGGFSPTEALPVSDDNTHMLLVEPERQAAMLYNGAVTPLPEKPAGFQAFAKKDNILLYGLYKHSAIARMNLPDTDIQGRPVVPGKLKPLSRNTTWKMFALSGNSPQAVLIDIRGNITLLEITKRRWKKSALLTVDRTGSQK